MSSTEKSPNPERRSKSGPDARLEQRLIRSFTACGTGKGSRLVVGVSGGPDSTALLSLLSRLCERYAFDLHACIVDHGIRQRTEVDGDIAFVERLAASLGAAFHVKKAPEGGCAARAMREKRSLEEIAREFRLGSLEELAAEIGVDAIVLGHTRDDLVETLLMRVIQGSGPAGLSGIALKRGKVIRPMLGCTRSEILGYLESKRLSYRSDSTNSETAFLRNRIRSVLIPVLDASFPGFRTGLLSMARKLSILDAFVEQEAGKRLSWKKVGDGFRIERKVFFEAPPALRAASLLSLYDALRLPHMPRRLPFGFLGPAVSETSISGVFSLSGHGVRLMCDGEWIAWERDIVTEGEKSYFINVETDGSHTISGTDICIDIAHGSRVKKGDIGIRVEALEPPLVLRSKRKGDELLLPYGRKSIKELFSEWKIPAAKRWEIPLLADRKGIVAVLGRCRDAADVVRSGAGGDGSEREIMVRCTTKGSREQ
jgi:tRNA(Ile)-lysidine synthetase-like protein